MSHQPTLTARWRWISATVAGRSTSIALAREARRSPSAFAWKYVRDCVSAAGSMSGVGSPGMGQGAFKAVHAFFDGHTWFRFGRGHGLESVIEKDPRSGSKPIVHSAVLPSAYFPTIFFAG
jgi:hypothetical protein